MSNGYNYVMLEIEKDDQECERIATRAHFTFEYGNEDFILSIDETDYNKYEKLTTLEQVADVFIKEYESRF